jgi:hypothetical protein
VEFIWFVGSYVSSQMRDRPTEAILLWGIFTIYLITKCHFFALSDSLLISIYKLFSCSCIKNV